MHVEPVSERGPRRRLEIPADVVETMSQDVGRILEAHVYSAPGRRWPQAERVSGATACHRAQRLECPHALSTTARAREDTDGASEETGPREIKRRRLCVERLK